METRVETLEAHDGLELYCQIYPAAQPKGVIITVHDYAEHSGVYGSLYGRMSKEGYNVYTLDLRGHGKSPGERAAIESFEYYLEDLDLLLARIRDREKQQPIFLMGQGMGALIAANFAFTRKPQINGLILCGPITDLPLSSMERTLAPYAKGFLRHMNIGDSVRKQLLQPTIDGDLKNDDLAFRGPVGLGTVREILGAAEALRKDLPVLHFGILTLCGEHAAASIERLQDSFVTHDKTFLAYAGDDHRLLLHPERDQVIGDILEWCDGRREIELPYEEEENEWENDAL